MKNVKFSYSNYFRSTPENLQYISVSLKTIVASVGGTTLIMESNKWVTFANSDVEVKDEIAEK